MENEEKSTEMNEQDASECAGCSGYSVRVTVQNKPVNLDNCQMRCTTS